MFFRIDFWWCKLTMELTTDCQKHWFSAQKQRKQFWKKKTQAQHPDTDCCDISIMPANITIRSFNFQLIIFVISKNFDEKKNNILTITTQVLSNDKFDSVPKITRNFIYLFIYKSKKLPQNLRKNKIKLFKNLNHIHTHTGSPIILQRSVLHPNSLTVKIHMFPIVVAGQLEKSLSCHIYTSFFFLKKQLITYTYARKRKRDQSHTNNWRPTITLLMNEKFTCRFGTEDETKWKTSTKRMKTTKKK